ncbi:MAG: hypothetical protein JST00_36495 [Deltaproteobacteria bacterium]|nr:hypothetical protein [Deltaproteobacteria bacterium]
MRIHAASVLSSLALGALAVTLSACGGGKFTGKVVSCADQKPVPDAKLKFVSTDKLNDTVAGVRPSATDKNGGYEANVSFAQNASLVLKVEKDGFESKEEKLSAGAPQTICIAPKK